MKLLVNKDQELATVDLDVDAEAGICKPIIEGLGYRVTGPEVGMAVAKDSDSDGLKLTLDLPGVTEAAIVIDKDDVKKLKAFMNKDAIKFMVKALM